MSPGSQSVAVVSLHLGRQTGIVWYQTFAKFVPVPRHALGGVEVEIGFCSLFDLRSSFLSRPLSGQHSLELPDNAGFERQILPDLLTRILRRSRNRPC